MKINKVEKEIELIVVFKYYKDFIEIGIWYY